MILHKRVFLSLLVLCMATFLASCILVGAGDESPGQQGAKGNGKNSVQVTQNKVSVNWKSSASATTRYEILVYQETSSGIYKLVLVESVSHRGWDSYTASFSLQSQGRYTVLVNAIHADSRKQIYGDSIRIASSEPKPEPEPEPEKPTAPTHFKIIQDMQDSVRATWQAASTGQTQDGKPATPLSYVFSWKKNTDSYSSYKSKSTNNTEITIDNLDDHAIYMAFVVAKNSTGAESKPTEILYFETDPAHPKPPGAPRDLKIWEEEGKIYASWTAPENTGLQKKQVAPILDYNLYYKMGTSATKSDYQYHESSAQGTKVALRAKLKGLTEYTFVVSARNIAFMEGEASSPVTFTTATAEEKPGAPTVQPGRSQPEAITITWKPPSNLGKTKTGDAAHITSYTLYWQEGDSVDAKSKNKVEISGDQLNSHEYTVSGLRGKTKYSFVMLATNSVGRGLRSEISPIAHATTESQAKKPTSPENIRAATLQASTLTLEWDAASNPGKKHSGDPADLHYTVSWTRGSTKIASASDITGTSHKITDLEPNTGYTFSVTATNTALLSSDPAQKILTTQKSQATAPGKPTALATSDIEANYAKLSWTAPDAPGLSHNGETAAPTYTIYGKAASTVSSSDYSIKKEGITATHFIVGGLVKSAAHSFVVVAVNTDNNNLVSTASSVLTIQTNAINTISTWQELNNLHLALDGDFQLTADITFPSPGTDGFPATGFVPAGDASTAFSGTFDGNNKKIINLFIDEPETDKKRDYVGLFGRITAATKDTVAVKNLSFVNPRIAANAIAGTLTGYLTKGTVKNIAVVGSSKNTQIITDSAETWSEISNALAAGKEKSGTGGIVGILGKEASLIAGTSTVPVRGVVFVGGLVGWNMGKVTGHTSTSVTGNETVGGLVGFSDEDSLVSGYAKTAVTGTEQVGGLVGGATSATVTGFATGDVSGTSSTGGLVGSGRYGSTIKGYATGNVEGKHSSGGLMGTASRAKVYGYATGNVEGKWMSGGLIGSVAGGEVLGYATGVVHGDFSVGGLSGSVSYSATVFGYTLSYITKGEDPGLPATKDPRHYNRGPGLGFENQSTTNVYVGRTQDEADKEAKKPGTGDHIIGIISGSKNFTVVIEGTASQSESSFASLTFTQDAFEWQSGYTTKWPILNFPTKISNTEYLWQDAQNPEIKTPDGYVD